MMNQKKIMVAIRPNSAVIKAAVTILIALTVGLACTSTTAFAKKKKVKYGTIEITTNPWRISSAYRWEAGRRHLDDGARDRA